MSQDCLIEEFHIPYVKGTPLLKVELYLPPLECVLDSLNPFQTVESGKKNSNFEWRNLGKPPEPGALG